MSERLLYASDVGSLVLMSWASGERLLVGGEIVPYYVLSGVGALSRAGGMVEITL